MEANDARRDQRVIGRRREPGAVRGRRDPEGPRETGGEGTDALQPHRETDVGNRAVGRSQQCGGPFEASRQQVGVRGNAEGPAELTAEVGAREPRHPRQIVDVEPLGVPRVSEVLRSEEMPGGGDESHARSAYPGPTRDDRRRTSESERPGFRTGRPVICGDREDSRWITCPEDFMRRALRLDLSRSAPAGETASSPDVVHAAQSRGGFPRSPRTVAAPAMSTLVFVHGACVRDADWWWSRMTQPLAKRGVATVAVALPSCGEIGDTLGDLYDDVQACHEAIAQFDGPVVLCGHSYGGMIITEAGADDRVTQLLYVTSVMPDAGQSQADLIGAEPAPWLQPGEDGTVGVDPDMIREFFLQDCDERTTEQAVEPSHAAIAHAVHPGTPPDRLAAQARHVLRVHRGSRHAGRGPAATRQSGHATRRVSRRAPPVPVASRRVRGEHRRRDRTTRRLSCPSRVRCPPTRPAPAARPGEGPPPVRGVLVACARAARRCSRVRLPLVGAAEVSRRSAHARRLGAPSRGGGDRSRADR